MSAIQQLLFSTKGQAGAPGVVTLSDQALTVIAINNALQVGYQLGNDGKAYKSPNGGAAALLLEQWVNPVGAAGLFEVYVSVVTGGPVNGTLTAWLPMTIGRVWYIQANTSINEVISARIAVTVRRVGQTTPEATAYIDLSAHR
jgi:hypothetical protein